MENPGKKSIRVLLVDDEEDLVTFLGQRLKRQGFTVIASTSGQQALTAAKQRTFDVAVLDLKMPHMDGIAVLQKLKEVQPFLEAIMLTGHGSHDSALEAGRLQAFRYLIKPYNHEELVALIQEAHQAKVDKMKAEFLQELAKVTGGGGSPREIIEASARLRQEYEQN